MEIKNEITGLEEAKRKFNKLAELTDDLDSAWYEIGEVLADSTKQRFETSEAPDGSSWAANAQTTILRYLGKYKTSFSKKTGKITAKGSSRAINKRPGIGETGLLSKTITYQVDAEGLLVGTPMEYGGTFHFGADKGEYGTASNGAPVPWGDIPGREFLGVSAADADHIEQILTEHIERFDD